MGLFLANTGLECLRKGDQLDERLVGELKTLGKEEKVGTDGSAYLTYSFPSGLELVFRMGGDAIIDGDMCYEGHSLWQAKPAVTIPTRGYLSLDLVLVDLAGRNGFAASILKPATIPSFTNEQRLDLSVSAFPVGLDVFDDRKSYEAVTDEKVRLQDGQVIPYNYLMSRQEGLKPKEQEFFDHKIQFNLFAGEVVALEQKDNQWHASSFQVATVRTVLGNLDVVFGAGQVKKPLREGCYLFGEALISAKVLAIDGKAL
ncbi:MAG: hypothetical protein MR519_05830 [Spirochaetaceae bacterium]|jgi:hypothetical protein|nr:hypothetical protein [Spirochaetaceae bacterium]